MGEDTKCFYCSGSGKYKYIKTNIERVCSACNGTGISFRALHKKINAGKNKCKYCGESCSGYACDLCLKEFEKEVVAE